MTNYLHVGLSGIEGYRGEKLCTETVRGNRITVLLSKCKVFQLSLASTLKNINRSASGNQKLIKSIRVRMDRKLKEDTERENNNKKEEKCQVSEIQRKIAEMLKKTKKSEQFSLSGMKSRVVIENVENQFIGLEEIRSPEAIEILKSNKRKFGEQFSKGKEQMLLSLKSLKGRSYNLGSKSERTQESKLPRETIYQEEKPILVNKRMLKNN